ncbi:MAG: hypothetical protein M0Z69_11940 [Actinomycetota bacterium]|nr:hypothetical protein [Actinomycetota bacterium]
MVATGGLLVAGAVEVTGVLGMHTALGMRAAVAEAERRAALTGESIAAEVWAA